MANRLGDYEDVERSARSQRNSDMRFKEELSRLGIKGVEVNPKTGENVFYDADGNLMYESEIWDSVEARSLASRDIGDEDAGWDANAARMEKGRARYDEQAMRKNARAREEMDMGIMDRLGKRFRGWKDYMEGGRSEEFQEEREDLAAGTPLRKLSDEFQYDGDELQEYGKLRRAKRDSRMTPSMSQDFEKFLRNRKFDPDR